MKTTILTLLALIATGIPPAWSEPLDLKPHKIEGVEGELRLGSYDVFEDRNARSGRRISLKVLVLSAIETTKQADPLFILAGGPGQVATANAKFFARAFAQVRKERDIVLIDQRGTGGSNGLECDLYGQRTQAHLRDLIPIDTLRLCVEEWKKRTDLRFYTTEIAMADLDEVRAALGYERINLFGTSYGTRAAQVYMRQFPERVRAVIMKGVTPMSVPLTLPMARDAQRALDLLFQDCAAEETCARAFPNLREEWKAVLARLDEGEIEVELPAKEGAAKERVKISRAAIAPTIRSMLQSVESSAELPLRIHQAFTGDFAPLTSEVLAIRKGFPKAVSLGVFLGISSAEDIPLSDAAAIARAGEGTFLRDDYFLQLRRAADLFPRKSMPPDYREPVRADIPTLLVSGYVDPATPPSGAEEVASHLPNSLHVVARYGSHAYGGMSPCIDNVMAQFIKRGSAEGIDTTCAEQIRRPPFVVK